MQAERDGSIARALGLWPGRHAQLLGAGRRHTAKGRPRTRTEAQASTSPVQGRKDGPSCPINSFTPDTPVVLADSSHPSWPRPLAEAAVHLPIRAVSAIHHAFRRLLPGPVA